MKLYIATKFENQDRARAIRDRLLALAQEFDCPLEVNARWLDLQPKDVLDPVEKAVGDREWSIRCGIDVANADLFLAITEGSENDPGGMHVETGLALAKGAQVFLLGPRLNVFHYTPSIRTYTDEDLCLADILRCAGAICKLTA
jgi:hypothetical protein